MINDLIYDVGMHVGDDTAFYLSQGYRVVAVEADPKLVKAAWYRFRHEIEQGKLEIVNVGISDTEGYADFWVCEKVSEWNSFDRNIASRDSQKASQHTDSDDALCNHIKKVWCTLLFKD